MKTLFAIAIVLILPGCVMTPDGKAMSGLYSSDAKPDGATSFTGSDGRVHTPDIVYSLKLDRSGAFETSRHRTVDGMPMMDSSLHAGGYDPHEVLQGTWQVVGDRLMLRSGARQYEARVGRTRTGWCIVWDRITYVRKPDKSPGTTRGM
jgi:hypothetical protein